jgi:acyl transferase domain-containing protein/phosphopantetheinyl transferase
MINTNTCSTSSDRQGTPSDIAIVGMAALFPGAKDLRTYWQNILNKVDAIENARDDWANPYFDPNSQENDRLYTRKGGFISDIAEFNPLEFGIMPKSVEGGDPDHFLALKLARDAIADAGYLNRSFNREKTGIILGRGTYVNRGFTNLLQHGMVVDQTLELLHQLNPGLAPDTLLKIRKELQASLPPWGPEMVSGMIPNIVTGRIANRLGLMGTNYVVDAACSSSLISIELAIKELLGGRCDMMLAGGVHAVTPPQLHMLFTQLGALSRSNIRPFDQSAEGTLLSEGLGIIVLKRLTDAEQDGDRIYAVIKGIANSSDGKALGLFAPRFEGQVLALERAYQENDIDPNTVTLIEAHGTGTPLGDQTEIQSLTHIFGQRRGLLPQRAVGSVKSSIGHCTIASGAASIIKTALAIYHKILPPTLCDQVNPDLEIEKTSFYINNETRPWIHRNNVPRRAGVNAFGFGGVNAHAILEEYTPQEPQDVKLLHDQWSTELLIFSGNERKAVIDLVENVQRLIQTNPDISLANLAYTLSTQTLGSHRLAIVVKDISDLENKLKLAAEKLQDNQRERFQTRNGIYYSEINPSAPLGKIAFLFPGEGSQYLNMLADLCLYFPKVRAWFDFLDETFADTREHPPSHFIFPPPTGLTEEERRLATQQIFAMDIASEIVFTASMALYELLTDFGIKSDVMVGHSTGESAALFASGTVQTRSQLMENIRYLNRIYRDLEAADSIPRGALLAVGAVEPSVLQQIIDTTSGHLYVAMDNCPNQAVLFGSESDIDAAAERLQTVGGICTRLPFDRAYHTSLFEQVTTAFHQFYDSLDVGVGHTPMYSCATTQPFPAEPEAIRALAAKQWSSRVRFRETIEQLYSENVRTFIEVGPSSNLTAFVDDILRTRDYLALASNVQRRGGLEQLQHLLARLCVKGLEIELTPLYQHRELTRVDLTPATLAANGSAKRVPLLDLNMPRMRLSSDFIESIQDKLSPYPQTNPEPVVVTIRDKRADSTPETTDTTFESVARPTNLYPASQENSQPNTVRLTSPSTPVLEEQRSQIAPLPVREEKLGLPNLNSIDPEPMAGAIEKTNFIENGSSSSVSPLPTDTRLSLLCNHFDLMQEFLDSQGRVITTLLGQLRGYDSNGTSSLPVGFDSVPLTFEDAWPLLGQIIERDFQHLYCERQFHIQRDVFLQDHTLGGQLSKVHPELFALPVIPFTISMEILAEAAACLVGGDKVVTGLYEIRGYRWLALDRGSLDLGIHAQLLPQQDANTWDVRVQLFQLGTTDQKTSVLVFEGYVRLSEQFLNAPALGFSDLENPHSHVWQDEDLYCKGMFHGPRFQGVKHIRGVNHEGIEADLQVIPPDHFFSHIQHPVFQVDAPLLDAATQLVAYWIADRFRTKFHSFPFKINAFYQYQRQLPPNSWVLCQGRMSFTSDRQIESHFDFIDETGRVIARLEGLLETYLSVPDEYHECRINPSITYWSHPWLQTETGLVCRRIAPPAHGFLDELGGVIKPIIAHWVLNENEREFWYALPEKGPRRSEWLFGRMAAKDALRQWAKYTFNLELAPIDVEILATPSGKPLVRCPALEAMGVLCDVSITHSRGYVVAAVAQPNRRIGIDMERLGFINTDDLLSLAFTKQELAVLNGRDSQRAIISLWCAKEAVAKAYGTGLQGEPSNWHVTHYSMDDKQVTVAHGGQSLVVNLWHQDDEILAICQI